MRRDLIPIEAQIFEWIETVFGHGVRRPGYEADVWCEEWLVERFTAIGLDDVHREPVPTFRWEPRAGSLTVWREADPAHRIEVAGFPLPHAVPTPRGGLEAALVPCDLAAPGPRVGGALAFGAVDFSVLPQSVARALATAAFDPDGEFDELDQVLPFPPRLQAVMEPGIDAGAAGFVGVLDLPWETRDYYVPYDALVRSIPGVWVSRADGARIRDAVGDEPARARLVAEADRSAITSHTVVGDLAGPTGDDDFVMIGSHHDGPWSSAVEDASGIALVLAQATYWSRIAPDERPHNLRFLLHAGHMAGGAGVHAFIERHRDWLARVALELHLEHAAEECRGEQGTLVPTGAPEVRWWFTSRNPDLEAAVQEVLAAEDLRRSLVMPPDVFGPAPFTDGGPYHLEGVPLVNFLTAPMYLFDSADTLDKIHRPSLEPLTRAAIRLVEWSRGRTAADVRVGISAGAVSPRT